MSDKWEVVGGNAKPRKPRPANGQAKAVPTTPTKTITTPSKPARRKKHIGPRENKIAKLPGSDEEDSGDNVSAPKVQVTTSDSKLSKKPQKTPAVKPKEIKPKDLATALKNVSPEQLNKFYGELTSAGSTGDVYLSWIKYSADALNTQLSSVPTPDSAQWPNNLNFPVVPKGLEAVIQSIITQTAASEDSVDVIGLSFSSILASIPTLVLRGNEGWGYLLFLREMCKIDPDVGSRRIKTYVELMDSYGNRKEIGICLLWVIAQVCLYSDNVLKILVDHIIPYYSFKHYKAFVLSVVSAVSNSPAMTSANVIQSSDFDTFFETSFDPKKRQDFRETYPKIRDMALRNVRDHGEKLFFEFLSKLGDKTFAPLSPYGQEVFVVLNGCLGVDHSIVDVWRQNFRGHLKESTILLNYLAKHPDAVQFSRYLESGLIQTDEFAQAAVQNPDLIRIAKKLQTGFERIEASRKRGWPWFKMGLLLVLVLIGGIIYIDVSENGKGVFAKSQTGEFFKKYGMLEKAQSAIDTTRAYISKILDLVSKAVRTLYEGLRPLLQIIEKQAKTYFPQVVGYLALIGNYVYTKTLTILKFLQENVFTGPLSPANLSRVAKDTLTLIWTSFSFWINRLYQIIGAYLGGQ